MKKYHCLAFVAAIVVAGPVRGQAAAHLAPLEFLVGHCWVGALRGGTLTDTHCFDWMYDKQYGSVEQRGDSLVLPSSYTDAKGQKIEVRTVWTRTTDGYHAEGFVLVKDKWERDLDVSYRRQK